MDKSDNDTSKALVKKEFTKLSGVDEDYSKKQIEYVRDVIAPSLNMKETKLFLYRSQKLGLNPLEGEVYAYSSYQKVGGKKARNMVMITSRDGKRKKAFQSGKLKSMRTEAIYIAKRKYSSYDIEFTEEEGTTKKEIPETARTEYVEVEPWEGDLWGARCVIKRQGFDEPFEVVVPLKEYKRKSSIWINKPETMIKKVAESQCLSMAFPVLLAGVYDEAENWQAEPAKELPKNGRDNKPATEEQIKTIKSLLPKGKDLEKDLTYGEAKEQIKKLATGKEK